MSLKLNLTNNIMKVLANDGVSLTGVKTLKAASFEVSIKSFLLPKPNSLEFLRLFSL